MTGSPLLRLALVLAGIVLLAIPALRLTSRATPERSAVSPTEKNTASVREVRFTFLSPTPPAEITVEAHGAQVAKLRPDATLATADVALTLPTAGIDLIIRANWTGDPEKINPLRVQASLDGNPLTDTTLWGDSRMEDVITLPGSHNP